MKKRFTAFAILALVILGSASLAAARVQDGYTIDWWTTDGGGGTSTAAGYSLSGTIGQPDASALSGGGYTLTGGYWGGRRGARL